MHVLVSTIKSREFSNCKLVTIYYAQLLDYQRVKSYLGLSKRISASDRPMNPFFISTNNVIQSELNCFKVKAITVVSFAAE